MAASATRRGRAIRQEPFTNDDSWGIEANVGAFEILDAMWGSTAVTVDADVTLTADNFVDDEARSFVLIFDGAGGFTVTAPAVDKPYLVINNCAAGVVLDPTGGTGDTIRAGIWALYYTNPAGNEGHFLDLSLDKIRVAAADVDLGSNKLTNVTDPTSAQDAATKAYVDTFTVGRDANGNKLIGLANATLGSQDATPVAQVESLINNATVNLPVQTGNSGKYLTTDGTTPSWDQIDIGTPDVTGTLPSSKGGTGRATLDANGVLYGAGTSAVGITAVGASGQVLTSNGAGNAPTFQTAASGGLVPLGSKVEASAVAAVDVSLPAGYDEYIFKFWDCSPATDVTSLILRTSSDGGSSFDATSSDYTWSYVTKNDSSGTVSGSQFTTAANLNITAAVGNSAGERGVQGEVRFFRPAESAKCCMMFEAVYFDSSGNLATVWGAGQRASAVAVDAFRLLFASGNVATLYGQLYGAVTS